MGNPEEGEEGEDGQREDPRAEGDPVRRVRGGQVQPLQEVHERHLHHRHGQVSLDRARPPLIRSNLVH